MITVHCKDHPEGHSISELFRRGELAVTPRLNIDCEFDLELYAVTVTHVPTGRMVKSFRSIEAATKFVAVLIECTRIDWSHHYSDYFESHRARVEELYSLINQEFGDWPTNYPWLGRTIKFREWLSKRVVKK